MNPSCSARRCVGKANRRDAEARSDPDEEEPEEEIEVSIFVAGKKTLTPKGNRLAGIVLLACGIGVTTLSLVFPDHTYMDTPNVVSGLVMIAFGVRFVWIGYRDK